MTELETLTAEERCSGSQKPCKTCEKLLIEAMKEKSGFFRVAYGVGHAFVGALLYLGLESSERNYKQDGAARTCGTCEKTSMRKLKAKSPAFEKFYNCIDHKLEDWIDRSLTAEDKNRALMQDPLQRYIRNGL